MRETGESEPPGRARSAVAQLCHDVRTPLHVINGYANLLSTQPLDAESAQYVERIRVALTSLREVIERAEGAEPSPEHGPDGGSGGGE